MMSALRLLRLSAISVFELLLPPSPFELPAVPTAAETTASAVELGDPASVLLAVALLAAEEVAELLLEETASPPLPLELPCPESDESWLGLISRSVEWI